MPVLHPSFVMRCQERIPDCISDLCKTVQVAKQFYNTTPTLEDVQNFTATKFAYDLETNRFTEQIICVGLSSKAHHAMCVPFRGAYIQEIKRIFAAATETIGFNSVQFDHPHLEEAGIVTPKNCIWWDEMLTDHLIRPDAPERNLEYVASIWCEGLQDWKHLQKDDLAWYNCADTDATLQIHEAIQPILKRQNLRDLYLYEVVPTAKICRQLTIGGIKRDPRRIETVRTEVLDDIAATEQLLPEELRPYDKSIRVRQLAPPGTLGKSGKPIKFIHVPGTERVVPWQSPKQVEEYLYVTKKYPKQLNVKTKRVSTDKTAIDRLVRKYPEDKSLDAIRKIRALDELVSTFVKESKDLGPTKVHANFLVHGTATGRLASSSPNMQNWPVLARKIFVPSHADWVFVNADFSSLENRLCAWYANDTERLAQMSDPTFNEHKVLCSKIYNIPVDQVDKGSWQYKRAKNTNHGADGALGPKRLSETYDIPFKEAKELILGWKQLHPKAATWQEEVGNRAVKEGVLTNAFGRKRWFWTSSGYTEGIRQLPQSTGADICLRSMVGLYYERINWPEEWARQASAVLAPLPVPARLVLMVHDSLLIECPLNLVEEVKTCLTKVMTQPWEQLAGFSIPIAIQVGQPGGSWGDLKD